MVRVSSTYLRNVWPTIRERVLRKTIQVSALPEFNAAEFIGIDDESVVAYLTEIIAADDAALLVSALVDVARARGIASFAETAGITRRALARACLPSARPSFQTITRLCHALGLKLALEFEN